MQTISTAGLAAKQTVDLHFQAIVDHEKCSITLNLCRSPVGFAYVYFA